MIKFRIYSVYDSKAESYSQPILRMNDAVAQRDFGVMVNDPGHAYNLHAEDYTLFCVGEWDAIDGKLSGVVPMSVCNGLQLKKVVA